MNISTPLVATAVLLVMGTTALAADKNEARLAKLLEGRIAGEPVSCIPGFQSDRLRVIERVALVYGSGDLIYVARPTHPQSLRFDDVIVIDRTGGQLCTTDIIRTVDRMGGFTAGALFLEKFVPYRKQN